MNPLTIRLLQRALFTWLLVQVLAGLFSAELLWLDPIPHPGGGHFGWMPGWAAFVVAVALAAVAVLGIRREPPRWMVLLGWVLYMVLLERAWVVATGGHWLVANLLVWSAGMRAHPAPGADTWFTALGLHAARLQTALAYLMAAINKLAGTSWTDGTALLRLAADPEVGPRWLLDFPAAAAVLGATVVPFLVTVSVAFYIPPLRRWALMAAALFHIITGVWFSIPDMALAFLVGLVAWLSAPEVAALERVAVRVKSLVINRM